MSDQEIVVRARQPTQTAEQRYRKPHPITGSQVVLTTGHLDHTPENCDLENLKHWCQRCHLTYDAKHHAQSAYMTRRCDHTVEMFEDTVQTGPATDG